MAGHSHASNVKHRKAGVDAKRAQQFTKICNEIRSCAKTHGADSPHLKKLLEHARKMNLPKDKIQRALSDMSEDGEEIVYQAFVQTVALIIHTRTNNKNRSAAQIRTILTSFGGDFAACSYLFDSNNKAYTYIEQPAFYNELLEALSALEDIEQIYSNVDGIRLNCTLC